VQRDTYRTMLLGVAPEPALLGKATNRAFRQFVEDMLRLLTRSLNPYSSWQTPSAVFFSRRDILQIITALIENAAASDDRRICCRCYSRGLILWAALLKFIPEGEGPAIEQSSLRWPCPSGGALSPRCITAPRNAGRALLTEPIWRCELSGGRLPRFSVYAQPYKPRSETSPSAAPRRL
jgi:hypothetical protein